MFSVLKNSWDVYASQGNSILAGKLTRFFDRRGLCQGGNRPHKWTMPLYFLAALLEWAFILVCICVMSPFYVLWNGVGSIVAVLEAILWVFASLFGVMRTIISYTFREGYPYANPLPKPQKAVYVGNYEDLISKLEEPPVRE